MIIREMYDKFYLTRYFQKPVIVHNYIIYGLHILRHCRFMNNVSKEINDNDNIDANLVFVPF